MRPAGRCSKRAGRFFCHSTGMASAVDRPDAGRLGSRIGFYASIGPLLKTAEKG
ncbi:hypothetical protein ALO_15042 [Acetonema longum DSM 6540]|uniref:Uncharacterized protein n=1 Tax=Acetonema longum DSM 6540 TaxID=1009370 RepID=F7NLN4_9FIRM|nr:hypothetical protein ALO_15042 [Acetonema longum DSM 6540]